jgi:hypothetical protein
VILALSFGTAGLALLERAGCDPDGSDQLLAIVGLLAAGAVVDLLARQRSGASAQAVKG